MLKMEHAGESYLVVGSKDGSIFIYTTTGQVIHQSPALKPMTEIDAGGVIHLAVAYKGTHACNISSSVEAGAWRTRSWAVRRRCRLEDLGSRRTRGGVSPVTVRRLTSRPSGL